VSAERPYLARPFDRKILLAKLGNVQPLPV